MLGEMLLHKCQCARTLSCTSIQSLDELDLFVAAPSGMNSWYMTPRYSKRFLSPCLFSDSARIPWLLVTILTHVVVHCEDHTENVIIHHLGVLKKKSVPTAFLSSPLNIKQSSQCSSTTILDRIC
jgi:hypothetical protein